MKHITFYLDFISPYAYLAFNAMPGALMDLSYSVTYKPVLLGSLLAHHGQLGPAEIPAKRDWTTRHVLWQARQQGLAMQMPATHPFNPLSLLRLAASTDPNGHPNRYVCETLFRHVWEGGADAADTTRLAALVQQLAPKRDLADASVKAQLKAHGDEALAHGVFGVPAYCVDDKVFWGLDALPMLRAYMEGEAWFDGPDWGAIAQVPAGIRR